MDLSKLATLKEKLQTATEFNKVQDYFLTNFGENREFMALGAPTTHPLIEAVLGQVAAKLFQTTTVTNLRLTGLPEEHFIHGACFAAGSIGTVFYFDDIHIGLACFATMGGQAHYSRFTGRPLTPPPEPSLN